MALGRSRVIFRQPLRIHEPPNTVQEKPAFSNAGSVGPAVEHLVVSSIIATDTCQVERD